MRVAAVGAGLLALGTALGAFGAHALRGVLTPQAMAWYERGHFYHTWVAVALLGLGVALHLRGASERPAWIVVAGLAVFAGTLYGLALTGARWLGAVTPIGGALLIVGWAWSCAVLWPRPAVGP